MSKTETHTQCYGHIRVSPLVARSWASRNVMARSSTLGHASVISLTIVVAHNMYVMPSYPYLATDYDTQLRMYPGTRV
ncbi:putative photosystem I [Helianthus anomalus]